MMTSYIRHIAVFCALLLTALLVNVVRLQVVRSEELDSHSGNRRSSIERYSQARGAIVVDGEEVAGSVDTGQNLRFERTYREGKLYAPVTGFDSQVYGATLLEDAEDEILTGNDPALSPLGSLAALGNLSLGRRGSGQVLTTLDPDAQRAAYEALAGRKGAVAAVEPATGRILALVSTPSYDPAVLSGTGPEVTKAWRRLTADKDKPLLNRAARQTYPPGSTFKVVTAAAALDAGAVRRLDAGTDSPDPYRLPGSVRQLSNETGGCANASLRVAFARSCNTVFAKLAVDTGAEAVTRTAERLGFNRTGLEVPFAVAPSTFAPGGDRAHLALSAIGQFDTRATPLQMAMVAGAVANGGALAEPHLVDKVTTKGGRTVRESGRGIARQAMSPNTARLMRDLMVEAVENGTGANARIAGAQVGGKTGTAQHGVDNSQVPYAWFISWAQGENDSEAPVAVAVVVEDAAAKGGEVSGGKAAAPVARAVMRAVLGG